VYYDVCCILLSRILDIDTISYEMSLPFLRTSKLTTLLRSRTFSSNAQNWSKVQGPDIQSCTGGHPRHNTGNGSICVHFLSGLPPPLSNVFVCCFNC
jgi:hypothetical protein